MSMIIRAEEEGPLLTPPQLLERLGELDGLDILELGCGAAQLTRLIAESGQNRRITALEVDRAQHEKNLAVTNLPAVRFGLGGAEAIPLEAESHDRVLMSKSLHHVPLELMDRALDEISRVLRPGGRALLLEPVYGGDFNEIMRLFNDEKIAREKAFAAVSAAVERGLFVLEEQLFFRAPMVFLDFAEFEARVLGVTYRDLQPSPGILAEVRARFEAHQTASGVSFAQPMRLDRLQKGLR